MRTNFPLLPLISLAMPALGQVQPRCIASRQVVLAFGSGQGVERAETWLTTDDGHSWAIVENELIGDGSVSVTAERDGRFGFYLVLENEAGRSAEPPSAGAAPHIAVIVDTAPPTLQVRQAIARPHSQPPTVDLRLTLIEENLGPGGLRVFYRSKSDESWTDGGPLEVPTRPEGAAEAGLSWPIPAGVAERLDLLLVCTDRAGNTVREEVSRVRTGSRFEGDNRASIAASQPTTTRPSRDSNDGTPRTASHQLNSRRVGDLARSEQMRALAARFLAEGRMDLAAARFSDALAEAPNDPQLLTEYGAALVRSNRLDDARQRFEAALAASPKNTGALEGLALVAMGQQRLPDARDTLKRALEIDGGAGRVWLRYGDVEYRMGNQTAAFDAWKKASGATGDAQLQATARERLKTLQK